MKKIMLIVPPLRTNKGDLKKSAVNSGLWHIGSYLQYMRYEVKLLHAEFGDKESGEEKGWLNLRESTGDYMGASREWGLSDNEISRRIKDFGPDLIGINSLVTVGYPAMLKTAELARKTAPDSLIITGGSHPTALSEKVLRDSQGNIDYLVSGEGEFALEEILKLELDVSKIRDLPSISYLSNNEFYQNNRSGQIGTKDLEAKLRGKQTNIGALDILGFWDPSLIEGIPFTPEPTYAGTTRINNGPTRKYVDIFLSRGCPLQCAYCFTPKMWGQNFRTYSPEHIGMQLKILQDAGYEHLVIQDDNFSRGGRWAYDVMDIFGDLGFTWDNNGGLEVENLDSKIVDYMAKKGATTLFLPFNFRGPRTESIPEKRKQHYKKILGSAKEKGIYVYGSFILGFPEQTIDDMQHQVNFARELRENGFSDWITLYAFTVLPGTQRWSDIMKPSENGDWEPRTETGIYFEGGHWNFPRYSINTPQIGMDKLHTQTKGQKGFTFDEFNSKYYSWIVEINGKEKANQWFNGGEWPK
jgi:anaerobic magnesium-protoporphyrin IX monomethyl ester cyclase